ncbi:hypothetical protein KJ855_03630 [Patescibacteria group bacterium]|nr:hypothetical protein [Patescibacteria group bacterium]
MNELIYPKHIYDPSRRQIAVEYLEHELRKMLPSAQDKNIWKLIDKDVADWFENNNTLAPVRDFWNGFHGISRGFRMNALVYRITSKNIEWTKEEVNIDGLKFVTRGIRGLKMFTKAPMVSEVIDWYKDADNTQVKKEVMAELEDPEILKIIRDDDPIMVIDDMDDGVTKLIHDGNHRVMRRVLRGESKIWAYMGRKVADPMIYEHWVPTQLLIDVLRHGKYEIEKDGQSEEAYVKVIFDLLKNSTAARIEFSNRVLKQGVEIDKRIYERVKKLCEENNIEIPEDRYWS